MDWHFAQPILQFGPFDSWMLSAPSNMLFETGSHIGAFIIDLVGRPEIDCAVAGNPIALPGDQTVYRHWTAVGRANAAIVAMSISMTAGHADRIMRIRGRGGSAQLDYGRDIGWCDSTASDNPIFDSHATAEEIVHSLRPQGRRNRIRHLKSALAKRPDANPFEESIFRSISAFYADGVLKVDPRHAGPSAPRSSVCVKTWRELLGRECRVTPVLPSRCRYHECSQLYWWLAAQDSSVAGW